ncbi:unnamed protein product, partial [Arctogadus glacialis]
NDLGGHRSLVNKWTTFLKARLVCSVPGPNGIDTHFDELQDVFLMSTKDPKNPMVYTVFTTSSNIFKGSAVCLYSMGDIRRVFLGPYAHRDGPNYQWVPFQGRVPYPRPGTCPSKTFGGFDSTKDLPDDVVTFARSHPAMFHPVYPINNKPIMVKTDVDYQFTQIVVDKVEAEDGQYDVMFIGTDIGTVMKVVSVPRGSWHDLEEVLLEEMTVFREPTAITAMELSTKQQQLYLGSTLGVSQMPLHRCEVYGKACAECCLARDPYCAWDGSECSRYFPMAKSPYASQYPSEPIGMDGLSGLQKHPHTHHTPPTLPWQTGSTCSGKAFAYWSHVESILSGRRTSISPRLGLLRSGELGRTRRQDIRNGDPLTQCQDLQHQGELNGQTTMLERRVYGVENSSTFLECSAKSQRAVTSWRYQKTSGDRRQEVTAEERFVRTEQGLLIRALGRGDSGLYLCQAVEHGFMQTLVRVALEVIVTERLEDMLHRADDTAGPSPARDGLPPHPPPPHLPPPPPPPPSSPRRESPSQKLWYRDFLSLVDHPTLNSVDEFCEQVWKRERKHRRQKAQLLQQGQVQQQQQQQQQQQEQPRGQSPAVHAHGPHVHAHGLASAKWKHLQDRQKGRNRRTHELERAPRSV